MGKGEIAKVRTLSDRCPFLSEFLHKLSNAPLVVDPDARARHAASWMSQVSNSSMVTFYLLVEEHDYHCVGFIHGAYETEEGMGLKGKTVGSEGEY